MVWKPNVTVAAVVERDGRFLMVEEETQQGLLFNQPAGHLEPDESLEEAIVRETLEETRYDLAPTALVGIYQWQHPRKGITYLRFAFCGTATGYDATRPLDAGIVRAAWLTPELVRAQVARHRSPLVLRCLDDYLAGKRYPLDLVARHI